MARMSEGMCEDAEDARDGCMIVIHVYYKSSSRILSLNGDRHRVATTEARRFVYANIVLRAIYSIVNLPIRTVQEYCR
jgi:hypothetical protein